jgi:hypothetical protein
MFGLFKKKSEKEKLIANYKKLKQKAFETSKLNRRQSDEYEAIAHDVLIKIEELEKHEPDKSE